MKKSKKIAQSKLNFARTHVHVSVTFRNSDSSCNLTFIQTQMVYIYYKKNTKMKILEKEKKISSKNSWKSCT